MSSWPPCSFLIKIRMELHEPSVYVVTVFVLFRMAFINCWLSKRMSEILPKDKMNECNLRIDRRGEWSILKIFA